MKQFLPLILLCGLVGCQKGSTSESQSTNADSVTAGSGPATNAALPDPSIQELINRLAPPGDSGGDSGSSAIYRMRGSVLVVNITDEGDMSWNFRLGLFYKNGEQWQSMFKSETVDGKLDTLIDMNGDDTYELIVNDERAGSAGSITTTKLYAQISGQPYEVIETLGITRAGFDAYSDHPVMTRSFEPDGNGVNIRVINELIPGMDPTVTGDQKYVTTTTERIWDWNGEKLSVSAPTDFLYINGNEIWVRDAPTTGKVVMKLDSRSKCKILEKGKEEAIRGKTDNWYKIDFNGKTGWVFGSQTSVGRI